MKFHRTLLVTLQIVAVVFSCAGIAHAELHLPAIFNDHMVLQRDMPVPIWGKAAPGVSVTIQFNGQVAVAVANDAGKWSVPLEPMNAGGPYEFIITTNQETRTLTDVYVGEVWLCSGQSNMDMRLNKVANGDAEVANADHAKIRLFRVERAMSDDPQDDVEGSWAPCTPESVEYFSAVAYFLGRDLHQELKVPVGLIHCAYGGTPAEAWTSREAIEAVHELTPIADKHRAKKPGAELDRHDPYVLYNAMLRPLIPYAVRGATWYQGESNTWRSKQYEPLLTTMIKDWRSRWQQPDMPFGIVQLTSYANPPRVPRGEASWPELRESQLRVANNLDNTGLIVTIDIGDPTDVHPLNKQDIGHRLALWAMDTVYGHDVVSSGPVFRDATIEGDKVILTFDHTGSGLAVRAGGALKGFVIAGPDRKFRWAKAEIMGDQIVVSEAKVPEPQAVRYAWDEDPYWANLINAEGLPATPFRTDNWPGITDTSR